MLRACRLPLDPVFAERLHLLNGIRTWGDIGDEEIAARLAAWDQDPAPYTAPNVSTRDVALEADGHRFHVRVYGSGARASPCLAWVHGGGFFAGSLEMPEAEMVAREIADCAKAVVVSVDYGLVPEVAYPHASAPPGLPLPISRGALSTEAGPAADTAAHERSGSGAQQSGGRRGSNVRRRSAGVGRGGG